MSSTTYPARAAFFGRQRTYTVRALTFALTFTLVYSIPLAVVHFGTLPGWYQPNVYILIVAVSTFGGAAVNAYYNSGLIVSCTIAGIEFIPIGIAITSTSVSVTREVSLALGVGQLLLLVGVYGALVGTVGFFTGVGIREF